MLFFSLHKLMVSATRSGKGPSFNDRHLPAEKLLSRGGKAAK